MVFQLQILHASDFEAGLPALDDAVNFSTVINALRDDYANTLTLSSGDNYIPGPFFSASSDPTLASVLGSAGVGRADIAILNEIGIQASALGNHEFDLGPNTIADLIGPTRNTAGQTLYTGTLFPYLSTNLDFTNEPALSRFVVPDGQAPQANSIAKSVVFTVGGEQVGVIGATTPTLPAISSPGPNIAVTPQPFGGTPTSTQLDALAGIIQSEVDNLTNAGINKIVLLAHMQQLFIEQELAKRLTDVDVVIAGGSHTLLSDETDRLRPGDAAPSGIAYPIIETNSAGEQVLVVNTAANYTYVGRLVAEFDEQGKINTSNLDPVVNGAYATDPTSVQALIATNPAAGGVTAVPDPEVVAITDTLKGVVVRKDSNIFGESTVFLNGTRNDVRTQETNLGSLTADANLFVAKQYDPTTVISIKNGGGIRDNIGAVSAAPGAVDPNEVEKLPTPANPLAGKEAGEISQLDIENSLRFNNALSLVTVTAAQLKDLVEHGVSGVRPGATPGAFPQIGGFSFSFDATQTARTATTPGERVRSLAILNQTGGVADVVVQNGQVVGDPNRTFRMVTLSFLASGGDGYPFQLFETDLNQVDLASTDPTTLRTGTATFAANGTEQDAFAEYLATFSGAFTQSDTPNTEDLRIQNLAVRTDTVLAGSGGGQTPGNQDTFLYGPPGDNTLLTGAGNDTIIAEDGNDIINAGDGNNFIQANGGNNRITAGSGNDEIYAGDGDDVILASDGKNTIYAENGNNQIVTGSGDDVVYAGSGDDFIVTGDGKNTIFSGNGRDRVVTGAGDDKIYTDEGDDLVVAGDGNNFIYAGNGNNQIVAGNGNNEIYAESGDDIIAVGNGNNTIYVDGGTNSISTGSGNNIIYAGVGDDSINTGAGDDLIFAKTGNNVVNAGTGDDTVYFEAGFFNRLVINGGAGSVTAFNFEADDRIILGEGLSRSTPLTFQISGDDTLISSGNDLLATLRYVQLETVTIA